MNLLDRRFPEVQDVFNSGQSTMGQFSEMLPVVIIALIGGIVIVLVTSNNLELK